MGSAPGNSASVFYLIDSFILFTFFASDHLLDTKLHPEWLHERSGGSPSSGMLVVGDRFIHTFSAKFQLCERKLTCEN